jgi:hypothetical protein
MLPFPRECQVVINTYVLANITYSYLFFYCGRGHRAERRGLAVPPGIGDGVVELRPRRLLQAQDGQRPADVTVIHEKFESCS